MSTQPCVAYSQRWHRLLLHSADGRRGKREPERAKEEAGLWNPCCLHKGLPGKQDLCKRLARSVSRLQPFSTNVILPPSPPPLHTSPSMFFFFPFKADLLKCSQYMNRKRCVTQGLVREHQVRVKRILLSSSPEPVPSLLPGVCTTSPFCHL